MFLDAPNLKTEEDAELVLLHHQIIKVGKDL